MRLQNKGKLISYEKYLQSSYWKHLKIKLIYSNKKARCAICETSFNLLLHHERYDNLYHEKLGRDIVIVCGLCHTKIHYITILFIRFKVPLIHEKLLIRRKWWKLVFCIQHKGFVAVVKASLDCLIPA